MAPEVFQTVVKPSHVGIIGPAVHVRLQESVFHFLTGIVGLQPFAIGQGKQIVGHNGIDSFAHFGQVVVFPQHVHQTGVAVGVIRLAVHDGLYCGVAGGTALVGGFVVFIQCFPRFGLHTDEAEQVVAEQMAVFTALHQPGVLVGANSGQMGGVAEGFGGIGFPLFLFVIGTEHGGDHIVKSRKGLVADFLYLAQAFFYVA